MITVTYIVTCDKCQRQYKRSFDMSKPVDYLHSMLQALNRDGWILTRNDDDSLQKTLCCICEKETK